MPRARTRGDRIQVQLPLDVDAKVRSRAEVEKVSPSQVIVDIVGKAYRTGVQAPIETVRLPQMKRPEMKIVEEHEHKKKTVNGAGLHVCRCGAIRGVDGTWRQMLVTADGDAEPVTP